MRGQTLGLRIVPVIVAAYLALVHVCGSASGDGAGCAAVRAVGTTARSARSGSVQRSVGRGACARSRCGTTPSCGRNTAAPIPAWSSQDPAGREWHVKQPPHNDHGEEGPVEVMLSRVLSAVGYHQPPVYFLPSFTMRDASGTRRVPGGRFRLHDETMHKRAARGRGSKTRSSGRGRSRACSSSCWSSTAGI